MGYGHHLPVHANCTNESRGRYSFLPAVAIDNRPSTDSTAENTLKTNANNKKHFPFYIPDASIFINGSRSVRLSSLPISTSTKKVKDERNFSSRAAAARNAFLRLAEPLQNHCAISFKTKDSPPTPHFHSPPTWRECIRIYKNCEKFGTKHSPLS